jgi:hypothetical protein
MTIELTENERIDLVSAIELEVERLLTRKDDLEEIVHLPFVPANLKRVNDKLDRLNNLLERLGG